MKPLKRIRSHKIYSSSRKLKVYNVTVGITREGLISEIPLWMRQNKMYYCSIKAFKELFNSPNWSNIEIATKVKRKGQLNYYLGNRADLLDNEIKHENI
tara:strand:- start:39 stop:335 length:297 start_codon:yes stop_codon:yes gene_type:complete